MLGSRLQLATVFGDSPIVAGRFTGINNVTFALLLPVRIDARVHRRRPVPGPRGRQLMLAILGVVLLVDVAPMWGADVGGALAGLPALALVAMGLGQWKVRWRTVVLAVVGDRSSSSPCSAGSTSCGTAPTGPTSGGCSSASAATARRASPRSSSASWP